MPLYVYLIRHGETDWNAQGRVQGATDIELNRRGRLQARAVSRLLRAEPLRALYASPLKRALETAELIARPHGLCVRMLPGLRELDQGELEGLSFEELDNLYGPFMEAWRERPGELRCPGGETMAELQERAWEALEEIREENPEGKVAAVSHNLAIRSLICRIVGLPLENMGRLRQSSGAFNLLEHGERGWVLRSMNNTLHLMSPDGAAPLGSPGEEGR
ncbi:MAG: histidine phosphatase family protein [Nitrospinota bacterium]